VDHLLVHQVDQAEVVVVQQVLVVPVVLELQVKEIQEALTPQVLLMLKVVQAVVVQVLPVHRIHLLTQELLVAPE
jgi:hypothetical protein